jgi:hypothetical protein
MEQGKNYKRCWSRRWVICSNRMSDAGPIEKVMSEHGLEGKEEVSHKCIWEKSVLGKGNSQSRGPEVEVCLACLRNSKEARVTE